MNEIRIVDLDSDTLERDRLLERARHIRAMTPVSAQRTDSLALIRQDRDR